MAIGQGYVTATPLQMAEAVATIATGVRYKPRLVQRVEALDGTLVQAVEPEMVAKLPVRDTVLKQVRRRSSTSWRAAPARRRASPASRSPARPARRRW